MDLGGPSAMELADSLRPAFLGFRVIWMAVAATGASMQYDCSIMRDLEAAGLTPMRSGMLVSNCPSLIQRRQRVSNRQTQTDVSHAEELSVDEPVRTRLCWRR